MPLEYMNEASNRQSIKAEQLIPAKIAKTVNFECGCMSVYHFVGDLDSHDWELIPCNEHAHCRELVAEQADNAWKRYVKEWTELLPKRLSVSSR